MIKKVYVKENVVKAAKMRIKNIFNTATHISLSVSGGKDSICLNDLIFHMCETGEIDKSKLRVIFIDEEAIYDSVEQIVKRERMEWLSIGVPFEWFCIQVKHFNCFNALTNDESFICWDETKKDVWVRNPPPFAIRKHPLLKERSETYQSFLDKYTRGDVNLIGVRCAESVQRLQNVARSKSDTKLYPIYDWKDSDVWLYIKQHELEIPDAYMKMYQVGRTKREMRISQFFSIDTAKVLVQMGEFYPDLFEKICRREPNAYMAMLYFDTELFRRSKTSRKKSQTETIDYKAKFFDAYNENWRWEGKTKQRTKKSLRNLILQYGAEMTNKEYKMAYEIAIAGDPKGRTTRALATNIGANRDKEVRSK